MLAGVEQREAAGAVGRLDHAGLEAGLADGGGLLVAGHAERSAPARRGGPAVVTPNSPAQSHDLGQQRRAARRAGSSRSSSQAAVADVEQQGAAGVGGVGGVHLAAGQAPEQEAVDRAEGQLALLGRGRGRRRRSSSSQAILVPEK